MWYHIYLTLDLDGHNIIGILQALLHLAPVKASVTLPQVVQLQREVGRGVGVVQQQGSVFICLANPYPVAPGHQDLHLLAVTKDSPFDSGEGQHGVPAISGGWRRWVGQRNQAG